MEDHLYLRVLKFLNFRPRSEKEVRDYIKKVINRHPGKFERTHPGSFKDSGQARMTEDNLIDSVIHKLKQQKFLDDVAFARWLVRSRTEFKPKGKQLVRLELRQKGIAEDIISSILEDSDVRQQSDKELAIEVLTKKQKKYAHMEPQERFAKAGAMLARRGFGMEAIKAAIDQVFPKVV